MKALITSLICAWLLTGCSGDGGTPVAPTPPERITIAGIAGGDLGIFDPSITRDPGTGTLWMSYSTVNTSIYYPPTTYWAVEIRLASSLDNGASWQDAGLVAPFEELVVGSMMTNHPTATIPLNSDGIWQSETSSLIYDPGATVGEEWKLIWFQYLSVKQATFLPESFFADYSWIAMKTAATPAGLGVATPVKLFSGVALQPESEITATALLPHIADAPAIQLNTDLTKTLNSADLNNLDLCVFAEPGLYATDTALYMAIYCADATTIPVTEQIEYFRCASPCDMTVAGNWQYLGRLLTPADAQAATDDDHFQAPALVELLGKTFLIVTPVDTTSGNRYNGCRVYELTDVDSNTLVRSSGQLVETERVDGDAGTHNGACAAFSGLDGGIVLSQFEVSSTPETFRMYKSQVSLP